MAHPGEIYPCDLARGTLFIGGFGGGPKRGGETIFDELQKPELDWIMIDSTIVRAHQHAAGQKKVIPVENV